jgi:hypothetical protein
MDSVSNQIEITYEITDCDVDSPSEEWQLLLKINGDIRIKQNGETLFYENEFCLVELASQLSSWINSDKCLFEYNSMEAEGDNPLISIKCSGGLCEIVSPFLVGVSCKFPINSIRNSALVFINNLKHEINNKYGINIETVLEFHSTLG